MKKFLVLVLFVTAFLKLEAAESDTVWVKDMKQYGETQVKDVRFSLDDRYAFVLCLKGVYMFETETGKLERVFKGSNSINSIDFFVDNKRMITTCWDSTIMIWDIEKDSIISNFRLHKVFASLKLYNNETEIIMYSKDSIYKYSLSNYELLESIYEPNTNTRELKLSKDSRFLASIKESVPANSNYWVSIYDSKTFKLINNYRHPDLITDLKFSNDGKYLVSCGWKNTIILWDLENNKVKDTVKTDGYSSVWAISFSPDSKYLVFTLPSVMPFYTYIYKIDEKKIVYKYNTAFTRLESSVNTNYILGTDSRNVTLLNAHWQPSNILPENEGISSIVVLPNPINGNSIISLDIPIASTYNIVISDDSGLSKFSEQNKFIEKGTYQLNWDIGSVSSGIYFCRISSVGFQQTIKLILAK